MARKKPIISPLGQWAYPGEVTVIPSSNITMKGVNYPVLGIDDLGNQQMMMPGGEYDFPGNYVTEYPQMNKGGQMIKRKDGSYSKRGLWDNIRANKGSGKKPTKEMLEQERKIKAKMQNGGWLDQYQDGGRAPFSDSANYSYDKDGNLIYTNYPFGFTYSGGINHFINDRLGYGTKKPLNNYEIDFLENAKNKIENLDIYPQHFDFQVSTQVDKLNPSLEELIKVTQNTYPDQYAIDNSFSKASKSDSKINLPASAFENDIKERYVIPNVLKNSINKSFGTLPTTQEEGYSPNRIWTTKVKDNERSGVGAAFTKPGDYAYILTPNSKKTSGLSKEKINTKKENIENSLSSIDNKFYEDIYEKYPDYIQYPGNYNNPEISLFGDIKNRLPNQMWNRAEQMRVEMINNPEIKDWADLHNLNLSRSNQDSKQNLIIDDFAPKVPESVYTNRLVKAGLPVSTPDYNYGDNDTYIAQDPSKFNLAGYFPIPEGYSDENAQELIAKKLGIKKEQLNSKDYLIHYNKSPITEYTPGKKYGGWLDTYQVGGSMLSMGDYDLTTAPKRGNYLLPDINRPSYIDDAGERRTEYKIGKNIEGKETLIPSVVNGRQLSEDEAVDRYYKTGLHMGQFNTPEEANYAARLRTARYKMLEDPIGFKADEFQVGGVRPPIYTSNPRRVQLYQDSLDLYNKYQPSFDKYKNFTRVNNIQTSSLTGNNLFNQYWGPYKPKGPSPYNENIIIKPVEEMMHQYLRARPGGPGRFSHLVERSGNNYLETKPSDYLKPNPRETRLFHKVGNDGRLLPEGVGITAAQRRINAARRSRTFPVSVTKQDFLDLGLTGVTPDLNSVFRFKKPVQPYILTSEIVPEVVETPVVEPPKPSLFVSNIDRDMYTPNGGMAREYNIGVTLQDGSKKAFRTEKEYQDWKTANNLDISNAKVSEGRGYSYNYPENKKYGGWLNKYQTGGWDNWTPNVGKPYMRTSPAGNAGYSDNTRVVMQNTNVSPANRKAAEAAGPEKTGDSFIKYVESTLNPYNWGVTDYTKSGTFKQAFNAARKAGEKEFIWNDERFNTDYDGTPAQQLKETGLTNEQIQNRSKLNKNITKNIYPYSYEGLETRILSAGIMNEKEENRKAIDNDPRPYDKEKLDALNLYAGIPQENNTFAISKHKPSKSTDNINYYTFNNQNDRFTQQLIDYAFAKSKGVDGDGKGFDIGVKGLVEDQEKNVMGTYKMSTGKDDKGSYVSFYDKWDLSPVDFGKPFEIYDRIYTKDYGDGKQKRMYYSDKELSALDSNKKDFDTQRLQRELSNRGYKFPKSTTKYGDLDGIYGDETKNALLDWQNKNSTKKQNGGWLDQFQTGGPETSTEQNPDRMQAVDIRKKRSWSDKLRGFINQGEKAIGLDPYNERSDDFMEQWARRVNDATGGRDWYKQPNDASGPGGIATATMETIMAPFSAPQYAAVYGATGKVQMPSEAMNIQNPYLAFGVNAVTDPLSYVGAGLTRTGQKFIKGLSQQAGNLLESQIKKNPRLALSLQKGRPVSLDNVNSISGIRYGDLNPISNNPVTEHAFFRQLEKGVESLDNSLSKRVADLESEEGFRRLVEQEKAYLFDNTDTDLSVIDRVAKLNAKARIEELKNIKNVNKEAAEYANSNFLGTGRINPFVDNTHLYDNAYHQSSFDYVNDIPSSNTSINLKKSQPNYSKSSPGEIGIGYNYVGNVPIEMHEIAHALQRGRKLSLDKGLKNIVPKKELKPGDQRSYKYFRKAGKGQEPTAFANELRESMFQKGFIPDYYTPINQQQIQDAYKYFKNNPMGIYDKNTGNFISSTRIFDFMEPNKANSKLLTDVLNRLPAVAPLAVGTAAASQLQEQKKGGQTSWLNKYK